jgi:hypothetical protein
MAMVLAVILCVLDAAASGAVPSRAIDFGYRALVFFKGKAHASQFAAASVGQRQCRP